MKDRRPRAPGVFPRFSTDDDVDREIRAHLEMRAEELIAEGWEPAEAEAEARRRFGDRAAIADECVRVTRSHQRAVRRGREMGDIVQDIRYAVRSLAKAPAFTLVALVTLGLGIGANTAIFSVVDGVLLRPLPYERPDELVAISEVSRSGGNMTAAWANFRDWRESARSFQAMAAYSAGTTTVVGGAEPAWATVARVSEDFFQVFPVVPVAGRLLQTGDHQEGAAATVVVSESFAREVLGGTEAVGTMLDVFGARAEVVGIVPRGFDFPAGTQVWGAIPQPQGNSRTAHNWRVVGRMRGDVTTEAAAQEVDVLMKRIAAGVVGEEDSDYLAAGARTIPLRERMVGDARRPLYFLLGAAAFVLLVACTNLASTLLARGTVRGQELAVRSSLGAGRGRLVRQLLTESGVLALGGSVVGVAMAAGVLKVLESAGRASVPRLEGVSLSGGVLLFTLATALVTAMAFGLLPALRSTEGDQALALRTGSRGNAGFHGRTWGTLVATEVALALMLLVGSGLLMRSFVAVMSVDGGFDSGDVATTTVALNGVRYPEIQDHARFWDELLPRVEAAPGVAAAGLISSRPVSGGAPDGQLSLDGDPTKLGTGEYVVASAGTFAALDVPLLQGRLFQESDGPDAPHVVVVSRSFAQRYWPDEDPIGRQVSGGGMDNFWNADPPLYGTVVGVVGDVRYRDLTREGETVVYWHYKQRPFRIRYGASLVVESAAGDPNAVAAVMRSTLRTADPDVAVQIRNLDDLVADSVAQRRFLLLVLGGFGAVGLVLAAVGIYGVVSYSVARRTREMGIRLALGAGPASVRGLVLAGALRPVVAGLVLGIGGGLALSRIMASFLYQIPPTDLVTFTVVPALLLVVAVAASWLPARRGTRIHPITAMRAE